MPKFEYDGGGIRVTLFRNVELQDKANAGLERSISGGTVNGTVGLDEYLQAVLRLIQENPQITYDELAVKIGKNRRTVSRYVSILQNDLQLISRAGSDKTGRWVVNDEQTDGN